MDAEKVSLNEVDRLFGESDENKAEQDKDDEFVNTCDPTCWDCEKPIRSKKECFPKSVWGKMDNVLFRCEPCWKQHCSTVLAKTKEEAEQRKKHQEVIKAKKATTPKSKAKTKTPPKSKAKTKTTPKAKSKTKTPAKTKAKAKTPPKSKTTPKAKTPAKSTPKAKTPAKSKAKTTCKTRYVGVPM